MELISDKKIEDTNSQRSHMVGLGWYEIFEEYPGLQGPGWEIQKSIPGQHWYLLMEWEKGINKIHVQVNVL
jgi:hypothetical protein